MVFNGLVYKSGSLFTSNYLKEKHNLSYTSFVGALGGDHLMMILINWKNHSLEIIGDLSIV